MISEGKKDTLNILLFLERNFVYEKVSINAPFYENTFLNKITVETFWKSMYSGCLHAHLLSTLETLKDKHSSMMNDKAEYQRGRDLSKATGLAGGTAKICSMGFLDSKVPKLSSRFHSHFKSQSEPHSDQH